MLHVLLDAGIYHRVLVFTITDLLSRVSGG